jgi:hypothetical protein
MSPARRSSGRVVKSMVENVLYDSVLGADCVPISRDAHRWKRSCERRHETISSQHLRTLHWTIGASPVDIPGMVE